MSMLQIDLQGKNALVGGASQGIGRASAIALAACGASVTLMARNHHTLEEVMLGLDTSLGQQHHIMASDTSDPAQLLVSVENHLRKIKDAPVHILVNNTGGPAAGPAKDAHAASFEAAFRQHLISNHLLAQTLIPGMRSSGYGRIINIISTSVKVPLPNLGVSNTIRAAVANWAKTLSQELAADGITVNNILPGATATGRLSAIIKGKAERQSSSENEASEEMLREIPARRFGLPEELAYAVCFLASPMAAYINGINLPVDGGRTGSL